MHLTSQRQNDFVLLLFNLGRPKESSHCKLSLLVSISDNRKAILVKQAIELPCRHVLIVTLFVPGIVEWHLKVTTLVVALRLVMVPIRHYSCSHVECFGAVCSTHLLLIVHLWTTSVFVEASMLK